MTTAFDFTVNTISAQPLSLNTYKGKLLLVVNTASQCGFTPQYRGLEALYQKYKSKGFVVLAFPCNQFGAQEPGTNQEIAHFCEHHYNVTFPVFEKIEVNGPKTHPLFEFLKSNGPGILGTEAIKWNFTKFLIDRQGKVAKRYAPQTTPEAIEKDIEKLL